jgi:hypothetical protein
LLIKTSTTKKEEDLVARRKHRDCGRGAGPEDLWDGPAGGLDEGATVNVSELVVQFCETIRSKSKITALSELPNKRSWVYIGADPLGRSRWIGWRTGHGGGRGWRGDGDGNGESNGGGGGGEWAGIYVWVGKWRYNVLGERWMQGFG